MHKAKKKKNRTARRKGLIYNQSQRLQHPFSIINRASGQKVSHNIEQLNIIPSADVTSSTFY